VAPFPWSLHGASRSTEIRAAGRVLATSQTLLANNQFACSCAACSNIDFQEKLIGRNKRMRGLEAVMLALNSADLLCAGPLSDF
jgi:hypothetical protein